jgi:hypothetical protein
MWMSWKKPDTRHDREGDHRGQDVAVGPKHMWSPSVDCTYDEVAVVHTLVRLAARPQPVAAG